MKRLRIRHHSAFEYAEPIVLGTHRLMLRPRDSHVSRLVEASLLIEPRAALRWEYDLHGNSVAVARFTGTTRRLDIDSSIVVDHYGMPPDHSGLDWAARRLPLIYSTAEAPDLAPYVARIDPDIDRTVESWARGFLEGPARDDTLAVLNAMTNAIAHDLQYEMRFDYGTQLPSQTLSSRRGTCRDFALLMIEATRCLGLAARFISGYLVALPSEERVGSAPGFPHAWLEIYLPGAGWIEFDPTNGLMGSDHLIRVATARQSEQAMPVKGSFVGTLGALIGTVASVDVEEMPIDSAAERAGRACTVS